MPNCTTCFEIILSDCIDAIEFKLGLDTDTDYVFKIKDKFQNTYSFPLTTDGDGNTELELTAAEKAMFTPYSGTFYLTVWLENAQVDLWLCDALQTCVQFSFEHDETLGNIIECTSTNPPQPEGKPNDGDIAVWSSELGKWVYQAPCTVVAECPTSGGGVWGSITGTLSSQTDLVAALETKVDKIIGKGLSTNDLTNALKTAYDGAVAWITANGTALVNHLTNTSNPHGTTAAQVGAYTTLQVDTLLTANEKTIDLFVGNSTTSNTGEIILHTIEVSANEVSDGDLVWITEQVSSSQTSGTLTVRARIGTSAVPVDITLETLVLNSLASTATAGGVYVPINNYIHFSGGNIVCAARAFLSPSGGVQITDVTSPTLSATWYIYITSQKSIAGGTVSLRSSLVKRERQ